jgi:type IV fimbrial biogenesis protein FimT
MCGPHFCSMKITEDVRKYAAEQGIAEKRPRQRCSEKGHGSLATQANEILGALTISRSEAIRLNKRVVFCRSDDGTSCAAGGGNWQGWLVFADNNANDLPDAGEILRTGTIASGSLVVQSSPAISVQNNRVQTGADGFARSAPGSSNALLQARLSVCIATSSPEQNTREIRITAGGHAVVVPVNNDGECPSPSNS